MRNTSPGGAEHPLDALLEKEGRLPNMASLDWNAAFESILLTVQTEGQPVDTTVPTTQPVKWYRKRTMQVIVVGCIAGLTLAGTTAAVLGRDARTGQGAAYGDIKGWFNEASPDPVDETKYWVPGVDNSEVLDLSASNAATVLRELTEGIPVPQECPLSYNDIVPGTSELTKNTSKTSCQDTLISPFLPGPKEFISEDDRQYYTETTHNFLTLYTIRAIDLWASQYVAAAKSGDTASQDEAKKMLIESISWPVVLQLDPDPSGTNLDAYEFDYLNFVIEAVKKDDPFYFEIAYLTAADNQYPTYVPSLDWEGYSDGYQTGLYEGVGLTAEELERCKTIVENPNPLTIADHDFLNEMQLKSREQIISDWYAAHGKTR